MNINEIMEKKAKFKPVKILLAEGWDERVIQASTSAIKKNYAQIILLGKPKEILEKAERLKVDITKAKIIDHENSELFDKLAEKLFDLRKHKGISFNDAKKMLKDVNYFGCMYVHEGHADAIGSSVICPTQDIMKPALQILRKKESHVSEVGVIKDNKNDRYMFVSDCSLSIEPSEDELMYIALNAAEAVNEFDIKPKIAMLSFSTKGSGGDGPQVQFIRNVIKKVKEKNPNLLIDGEFQVDAAVNPKAAKRKCPDALIQGDANTLIFPNLNASNIFIHGIMQFGDNDFEFTIMKGLKAPVTIMGRSTPWESMVTMILAMAMQVNSK